MLNKKGIILGLCTALLAGTMAVMPVYASEGSTSTTTSESSSSTTSDSSSKSIEKSIEAQMDALDKEYEELFNDTNSDLWAKLQEAENSLSDDEYYSEDFDEKEFVQKSDDLTDEEKTALTALIDQEKELDDEMDKLCDEKEEAEWKNMTAEQKQASKKLEALAEQEDAIYEKHDALWTKVNDAEDQLSIEELCSETLDEASFIKKLDTLTDKEKNTLLKDIEKIQDIEDQMLKLEEIIYPE